MSVKPTIKQAKSAENLVQVLPNALECPCVSIKHALKKQGIKTLKPLISQGFQVSVSILVTQYGSGRRIRTLTYGVRVRCATFTQSRYVPDEQNLLYSFSGVCQHFFCGF